MLRAIYSESRNLFSAQGVRAIILGVVANFIYERACSVDHNTKVEISTREVVIESGKNKIIVPREVYDSTRVAEQNPQLARAINRAIETVAEDDHVKGIGLVPSMHSPPPDFLISQKDLRDIEIDVVHEDPPTRLVQEQCDLQIVKAILERSSRKWEFIWRGVRISAPVLDDRFYSDFFAHNITIAPGDELKALLAITQSRDTDTGIYTNVEYKVIQVYKHVPRMQQGDFFTGSQ